MNQNLTRLRKNYLEESLEPNFSIFDFFGKYLKITIKNIKNLNLHKNVFSKQINLIFPKLTNTVTVYHVLE